MAQPSSRMAGARGVSDDRYVPLPSKFAPPQFSVPLVARRRLIDRLDAGLEQTVITVCTPAGYGKTTLLSQWQEHLRHRDTRTVWIGLDEGEQAASHFALCFAESLARAGLVSQAVPQALAQGLSGVSVRDTLRSLIAELGALDEQLVLIFDDYHLAETDQTAALLDALCRGKPDALTVVVATRVKPRMELSRLRAVGRLLELTQDDLRFEDDEVAALLEGSAASDDVALLAERTERWAVALQLARIWAHGPADSHRSIRDFKGSHAELASYLSEQVLRGLSADVQDFLIETSILERVNGDLADALRGWNESWRVLDELERLNALVFALDAERRWYR
jgi:LuxR family transcriptional regulator, maltose regulon positive regulatory protein